jgi:Tfp pilus assembly protein PilN
MSAKDSTGLVIGGEPRIDFLPPEVKQRKQTKRTRRSLIVLVVIVMVACAGGYVFATSLAVQSQLALLDEQARTSSLLSEQAKYAEARTVTGQLSSTQDARLVATANEILWKAYLAELRSTLPSGMAITAVDIDSMSATDLPPIATVPLETERVATITMTATAPSLASAAAWLDNLREVRGFADLWATPATWNGDAYEVELRLNVNASAFEKRFFEGYGETTEAPADESGEETDAPADDESESSPEPESTEGSTTETPAPDVPSTENEG